MRSVLCLLALAVGCAEDPSFPEPYEPPAAECGNFVCELGETPSTCADCADCGNTVCEAGETGLTCAECATCGNAICERGEDASSCADCAVCGNDVCEVGESGATCADCATCGNDACEVGETGATCADCATCGNDTCEVGETAATCAECATCGNAICEAGEAGVCDDCPVCGDATCEAGETAMSCAQDCGNATLRVQNNSSYTIYNLYVAACGASGWGVDQTGSSYIAVGAVFTLSGVTPGCYNLRATDSGGTRYWQTPSPLTLAPNQQYTWTLNN